MGQVRTDTSVLRQHPVDNALFLYSSDIKAEGKGAEVFLQGFRSKALAEERVNALEFVSVTVPSPSGEEQAVFKTFREANRFLRDRATEAPSIADGAEQVNVYAEWQNKNGAAFKAFTAYYGKVFLTQEMAQTADIVERAITVRDMFDAGLLRPKGMDDARWADKQAVVAGRPADKEYLVSSLRHLEGVNAQFRNIVREHETEISRQKNTVSLRPQKGVPKREPEGRAVEGR